MEHWDLYPALFAGSLALTFALMFLDVERWYFWLLPQVVVLALGVFLYWRGDGLFNAVSMAAVVSVFNGLGCFEYFYDKNKN